VTLTQDILGYALALGFDIAGIVPAGQPRHAAAFADWLAAGYHGEMSYLVVRAAERSDPVMFAPDARSVIIVAANYNSSWLSIGSTERSQGRIARYAWGPDYHDVIKPKLHEIDAFIRARTGRESLGKVFVDTAPVLERDYAEQAGLGFIGRNCCLITPGVGSWTVLAGLLVPEELQTGNLKLEAAGMPRAAYLGCGRCTRCLVACPTQAFVAPHVLDARRCISYLTIELRGPIPRDLRPSMGDWVFGCDVCQEVCPYNKQAGAGQGGHSERVGPGSLVAASDQRRISLPELLAVDEASFRARFRGTPVLRAKRRGLVRNACVAAGNARDPVLTPILMALLADSQPLVRGHAAWALGQIGGAEAVSALAQAFAVETEPWVCEEITLARKSQS
jgi:epoxyqueuosine reductase